MHRIYPHPNIYFELGAAFFDLILLVYLCIIKGEEVRHKRFRYFVLSVLVAQHTLTMRTVGVVWLRSAVSNLGGKKCTKKL